MTIINIDCSQTIEKFLLSYKKHIIIIFGLSFSKIYKKICNEFNNIKYNNITIATIHIDNNDCDEFIEKIIENKYIDNNIITCVIIKNNKIIDKFNTNNIEHINSKIIEKLK